MDLEAIRGQLGDSDIASYDNLVMTFNDLNGTFMSQSGKPINFGYEVKWSLSPLVTSE